jgi:pilus assembly protein Flp/PilA
MLNFPAAKLFLREKKGATMLEYAIVVGIITLVAVGGATTFSADLSNMFTKLGTAASNIHHTANTE